MNRQVRDEGSGAGPRRGHQQFEVETHERRRRRGRHEIYLGLVLIAAGAVATIDSYSEAETGGTYSLYWGLAVIGLVVLIRGAARFRRAGSEIDATSGGQASSPSGGGTQSRALHPKKSSSIAAWAISGFILLLLGSAVAVPSVFLLQPEDRYDPSLPVWVDQTAPHYEWIAGIVLGGLMVVAGLIASCVAIIAKAMRVAGRD